MPIVIQEQFCPKNHRCPVMSICPVTAISQKDSFSAPTVDEDLCIECQKCSRACGVFLCVGCGEKKKSAQ